MNQVKQFREDSKQGGFDTSHLSDAEMLLEPQSFQAVGKTRGWSEPKMIKTVYEDQGIEIQATGCFAQQLYFNALLADGLTIEDSLKQIS